MRAVNPMPQRNANITTLTGLRFAFEKSMMKEVGNAGFLAYM
jgi:hypothetical protein